MHTLTIVGVGLIGASIGLAAKNRRLFRKIRGVGRNRDSLERAKSRGAVDEIFDDAVGAVAGADVVVVCTPVGQIAREVLAAAPCCGPETLLTDAGSTKARIVAEVEERWSVVDSHSTAARGASGVHYVGSHPLAGSEKRGPEHGDANLFAGRWAVVTPTPRTSNETRDRAIHFWQGLGSHVLLMSPEEHDQALALTSHLPHLAASALALTLPEGLQNLAATGFRDSTRIAAGDPALWTDIFRHNREALLTALEGMERQLGLFRAALERSDWNHVDHLLAQAKKVRDALGN